jgi:hypothetical protein
VLLADQVLVDRCHYFFFAGFLAFEAAFDAVLRAALPALDATFVAP